MARRADQALAVPAKPASGLDASRIDPSRLGRAIAMAARLHATQRDRAGAPYILHPLRVMLAVEGEDAQVAAVLHDVVEDCGVFLHDIAMQFGPAVGDAVDALTRRKGESYSDFIERCGKNEIARTVKMKDLDDNCNLSRLLTVTPIDLARVQKYNAAQIRLRAIAIEAATAGETAKQGSTEGESAALQGDRPTTPAIQKG